MVGVSLLPGSLTRERAKFWLSPMMTPSAKEDFDLGLVIGDLRRGGEGERLHALVFAVAAVGVGIEVADESALDGCAHAGPAGGRLSELISGKAKANSRMPRGLAKRTAVPAASRTLVDGGFGQLAEADDEEPFGGQTGGGMQQDRLIGPGLVFACRKHGGSGGLNGRGRQ